MRKYVIIVCCFCVLFIQQLMSQTFQPPVTMKGTKVFTEHGNKRTDDYYWLNNPSDSNVINHLKLENLYVGNYMKHTEELQKKIYDEIVARIPGRDESLPVKRNGFWYYSRFEEGKQYPYYARKKETTTAGEEVILDVPALAKNHQIYIVRGSGISIDNQQLAYGIDTAGDRRSTLYFKNLSNRQIYPDVINNTSGNYVWANNNKTIYYVINDHTVRPYKVMRHTLGTDKNSDREVYTESDSTYRIGLSKSKNNKYIFIHSTSTNTSEDRYLNPDNINASPVIIQPRTNDIEYNTDYFEGNVFHIYTNKDAKNFRFVTAPVNKPAVENWKDVIPPNDKAYLQNAEVLKDYYVAQTKENGLTQIKIFDRKTGKWKKINFGEEDFVANLYMATDDYASDSIRYYFTSLRTPGSEFLYNLKTGKKKIIKTTKSWRELQS
jgi:oligopeptidase B